MEKLCCVFISVLCASSCFARLDTSGINSLPDGADAALEEGMATLKDRCTKVGGQKTYEKVEVALQDLTACVEHHVNVTEIEDEVNDASERGALDEVFKKYCVKATLIRGCVDDFLNVLKGCMREDEWPSVNISMKAMDATLNFVCYKEGERIAIFMGEDGPECLKSRQEAITECIEKAVPEIKDAVADKDAWAEEFTFTFDEVQCGKIDAVQNCMVEETSKCKNPTPSTLLESFFYAAKRVTPCWKASSQTQKAGNGNVPDDAATSLPSATLSAVLMAVLALV